ncbi:type I-E CRISPR-associated protein Cse1/CasA [Lactobacillus corticis]|uniref:Type I-E CRISPR-associated protein Cse1/CasA n=1 Tax=Lactobacillus corticis TaxID=2201249 RepID=A0A916QF32_9LACO|nr:type I-E CRISPR-associated protein Cse1/CasA [Lactobacillus corticis]GFZ26135.1 hypothetical protein LCB40_00150 [Lactobacillus corticis]
MDETFNLVTQPWIQVLNREYQTQKVSLKELFENSSEYLQLAGEMKAQDVAVLRFLLSLLLTVYSRYDASGEAYDWLELDNQMRVQDVDQDEYDENNLLNTWKNLKKQNGFSPILFDYLSKYENKFDLLSQEEPFWQVSETIYDSLVPAKNSVASGKGTVGIRQINRRISESAHTPDVFSPKAGEYKDDISLDELARWIITYQNYAGTSDKTKVNAKGKFSIEPGWLYRLNTVFAEGKNLFETLLLNLSLLTPNSEDEYRVQHPFWEYDNIKEYIVKRMKAVQPDNLAELYTLWARVLHIKWQDGKPVIFTAGLTKVENIEAFIEPMTTWKIAGTKKKPEIRPAMRWIKADPKAMWRNFGSYVKVNSDGAEYEPGIVTWLRKLKAHGVLPLDYMVHLTAAGLISDGNATSQSPAAEFYDNMEIRAGVIFDEDPEAASYWPGRIEDVVEFTQKAGSIYWGFARRIAELRGIDTSSEFASHWAGTLYERLNEPFEAWLSGLTNDEERDPEIKKWKDELKQIVLQAGDDLMATATPSDIKGKAGDDQIQNIFTVQRSFRIGLNKLYKTN